MAILEHGEQLNAGYRRARVSVFYLRRFHKSRLLDDHVFLEVGNDVEHMLVVHARRRDDRNRIDLGIFGQHPVVVVVSLGAELFVIGQRFFHDKVADGNEFDPVRLHDRAAMMA